MTLEQRLIRDKIIHVQSEEFRDLCEAICSVTARFADTAEWKIITPTGAIYHLREIFGICMKYLDEMSEPFVIASAPDTFRDSFDSWKPTKFDESETEQVKQEIIHAGCDPDDPDSHEWRRIRSVGTPDGTIEYYRCSRCGMEDTN